MRLTHPEDNSPELAITLTLRQLQAIINALRELSLILEHSYNSLTDKDKKFARLAMRELMKSRTWNRLENALREGDA